ncbi:hypothetical protein ANCCAN_27134 [Ancylostoma caninum]|uniref:Calponin-homology (CH) domain-containing protein n=1 Tax=Ancylostoma caninum TaxID=29170 RepID=A0A368F4X9_ANCCA|nr:hypothetical protein ANCCAN_27134 [Ancylostoma caninum]
MSTFQVIPAIRLDDAEWKIIQQNTFTRWVNNHLKKAGDSIQSLERNEGQPEETPKQKLLNWIRSKLPSGMPLTNFTSDWNDGVAVGALVNALVPGAVMDWDQWTPENALENTQKAMQIAQERLGVEPVSF